MQDEPKDEKESFLCPSPVGLLSCTLSRFTSGPESNDVTGRGGLEGWLTREEERTERILMYLFSNLLLGLSRYQRRESFLDLCLWPANIGNSSLNLDQPHSS